MFNYLIFDIDNTIFNYSKANSIALKATFDYILTFFNKKNIIDEFNLSKSLYQNECTTASMHNKFIQFKNLLNKINISLDNLIPIYNVYKKSFINNIEVFDGLEEFLILQKQNNIKLYCLSNNLCKEQIEYLNKLDLLKYFEVIYTSEEFGIEKPDLKLLYCILHKINCSKNEVAFIGDSFNADIQFVNLLGIYGFWFNKKYQLKNNYTEFNRYSQLIDIFKNYYRISNEFIQLSKYVGERFDLVQAGGGNTSFKQNDMMFIKSSGCKLTDLSINKNYVGVNYKNLKNNIEDILTDVNIIQQNVVFLKKYKPSIETTMHSLTKTYTVHLHPLQFNLICALDNCLEIINELFKDICFIEYFTPGINVALEIKKKYKGESIIFLKNHGIVFTCDNIETMKVLIKNTLDKLERYLNKDFSPYKLVNLISNTMNVIFNKTFISYLSEDKVIDAFINQRPMDLKQFQPFFPDKLIYCGEGVIMFNNTVKNNIVKYFEKYKDIPKIFINDDVHRNLYISSFSLRKCLEIESVLKAHIICINSNNKYLDKDEIKYLNNWEPEKFRKNL